VKRPKKVRKVMTQDVALQELKFKVDFPKNQFILLLPMEMWLEILKFLPLKDLAALSGVDKTFYHLSGNEKRWKELCLRSTPTLPNSVFNQTYKTVYASSNLGPKKCSKCGSRTTRKVHQSLICSFCQPSFVLTKTQVKRVYMLKDEDLPHIQQVQTPKGVLFLKSDVEQYAIEKFKGIGGFAQEIQNRQKKRKRPTKQSRERKGKRTPILTEKPTPALSGKQAPMIVDKPTQSVPNLPIPYENVLCCTTTTNQTLSSNMEWE